MFASPVITLSVRFSVPVSPSTYNSAPCHASRPAKRDDEWRDTEANGESTLEDADYQAGTDAGDDRQIRIPPVFDVQNGHHRRGKAAHCADREVDFTEQQHVDDARRRSGRRQ